MYGNLNLCAGWVPGGIRRSFIPSTVPTCDLHDNISFKRKKEDFFFFFLNSITMQFITALLQMSQDNWTISFLSWLCCKCHTTIGLFHWDQMNELVKKDRTPKSFQDVGKLARAQNNPKSYSFPFSSLIFPWLIRTTGNEKYHNQILQNSEGPLPF